MSKITCSYLGDLKCEAKHLQSGNLITTDAPIDHCGKGENFSPTDLLAISRLLPSNDNVYQSKIKWLGIKKYLFRN